MPTEAQWEYFGRAGSKTKWFWGDDEGEIWKYANIANFEFFDVDPDGYDDTAPVGRFKPNGFGLYDTAGNVAEWCHDWCGTYQGGRATDPVGAPTETYRGIRGGGCDSDPVFTSSAYRMRDWVKHSTHCGARVVVVPGGLR